LLALIEKEIEALSPKMRQVFEMSRNTTLSRKEIAAELNLSEETVKSHIHHALKTLKTKLGPLFTLLFIFY
jgi:RNA polymerase sigma factor (sigma-70 family)